MKKKVVFIHSVPGTVESMKKAFYELYSDAQLVNIMDDGILPEVKENNGMMTDNIVKRVTSYVEAGEMYKAEAILCMCTTLGPVMDSLVKKTTIPLLKIDGPMMEEAVKLGQRIAILCTAQFTLSPSSETARAAMKKANKNVHIEAIHVKDAFDIANIKGDIETHDRLVMDAAVKAAKDFDVIVMAQVSMKRAADMLKLDKPVVTSIPSGLVQLGPYLK
jgi:Asp/Glu/hydantoin racemase